jgi:protein SCO1
MKKLIFIFVALAALLTACGAPHQYTGSLLNPPKPVVATTLTDHNGQPFELGGTSDGLTLLYFGFTNCPDYCPTTMGDWKGIKRALGEDAERVRFVMVSVDPERDTEQVLKTYLAQFDPAFVGLRPTTDQLEALSKEYGVGVDSGAAGHNHGAGEHNPMTHGTYTYVLDGAGQLRLLLPYDSDIDAMAADVRALLAGS